jgi:hypothetical protein
MRWIRECYPRKNEANCVLIRLCHTKSFVRGKETAAYEIFNSIIGARLEVGAEEAAKTASITMEKYDDYNWVCAC